MGVIDAHVWRLGIAPLFLITFTLARGEHGVHASVAVHIYKFGFHFALSLTN